MRLEPTQRAAHLSWAGLGLLATGLAAENSTVLSFGAALLFGVAISRGLAQLSVARARAAGFEMLWHGGTRAVHANRLHTVELSLELRNRDDRSIRFRDLSVTHAPGLSVDASPTSGEVPPHGRLRVELRVVPRRVGYQGIHGLTLTALHAPGLFTVPLSFCSPVVLEVLPQAQRATARALASARSPASSTSAPDRNTGRARGDGSDFRELREHLPGDAFKRIAWKASARRGRLLVTETERPEHESIWFLIDASVESAAGRIGQAPLDRALDAVARSMQGHLARGDRVGLSIVGQRELVRVPLGRGPRQWGALLRALSFDTHTADSDRSDWDESDVRRRVFDHLRGLDARAHLLSFDDYAGLVALATTTLARAPVQAPTPRAEDPGSALLMRYLLSFGIQPPPRGSSDRARTALELARVLNEITVAKPRPNAVHVFAGAPGFETPGQFLAALGGATRKRVAVQFHALPHLPDLDESELSTEKARMVRDALQARIQLSDEAAARELAQRGVRWRPPPPPRHL